MSIVWPAFALVALTLLVVMALGLRGSATWTMPIFAVVPVLLAGYVRTPDGQQLRRLRRLMAMALGLIALSGYGQERDRRRTEAAGFAAHFVKPVDLEPLHAAIESGAVPRS